MPESRLEALVTSDVASGVRGLSEVAGTVDRLSTAVEASARTMVNQGRDAAGATASVRGLKDQVELLTRAEQEQVTTIRIADEQWSMLAATHRNRVNPAHEQTIGGLRNLEQAAKANEQAFGRMGEAGGAALGRLGGFSALAGGGAGMLAGGAALLGGGLAFEAGKSAVENAEKQERAMRSLQQAAEASGQSFAVLAQRTTDWIQSNRSFVSNQYDAKEAMSLFVRAGNDQETSLKAMGTALDLATLKGLGIKESARMVELAMMGSGRAVRELGIDLKSLNSDTDVSETAIKELERAQAAAAKATTEHTNAQRSLTEMQDSLRGKTALTQIEHDRLVDKQNAVTKSSQNLATALAEVTKAQSDVGTSTSKSMTILEELSVKVSKGRDTATELTQRQNELRNSWQNLSQDAGPGLITSLTGVVRAADAGVLSAGFLWKGVQSGASEAKRGVDEVGAAFKLFGDAVGATPLGGLAAGALGAAFGPKPTPIRPSTSAGNTERDDMRLGAEAAAAYAVNLGRLGDKSYEASQQISHFRDESDRTSTSEQTVRDKTAWLNNDLQANADANRLAASAWDWNRKALYDADRQVQITDMGIRNIKESIAQANRDRIEVKVEASALDRLQQRIREISTQEFTLHFRDEHERSAFADSPSPGTGGGEVPYWGNGV